MGKPSKKSSKASLSSSSSKEKVSVSMSYNKSENMKRKRHNKTKKNIKKLFDELRSESCTSFVSDSSANNTVIVLDSPATASKNNVSASTSNKKATEPCATSSKVSSPTIGLKRKKTDPNMSVNKRSKLSESLIVIKDDSDIVTSSDPCSSTPRKPPTVQCSTPITKKDSKGMHDLITSSFPKNNNSIIQNLNNEIHELTKVIRKDSYITIDLTTETIDSNASKTQNNVIDLDTTVENNDCTVVSVSNASLSMSGESDVTVLRGPSKSKTRQMKKVFNGLSKLGAAEKNKMLKYVVEQILTGCNVKTSLTNLKKSDTATETAEDVYIKEVILGQSTSRNSIGSNIYNPGRDVKNKCGLRMVVIDGSNVAMEHSKGKFFSVKGLKICIDYFLKRGHLVKAFVPRFRCKFGKSSEPRLLDALERQGYVIYTPSREIQGRTITSYDDRYIVQCAAEFDGIIVSGDNYRDLLRENPRWRTVIENRLLQFTWVEDMIMFPRDPLGRNGPTLEQFLKHPNHNEYAKK